MAEAKDIQIFRNLVAKGVPAERAKDLITRSKTQTQEQPTEGLAQRSLKRAEEFGQTEEVVEETQITKTEPSLQERETERATSIQAQDSTISPEIAGSKARQQIAEETAPEEGPGIVSRVGTGIKEAFVGEEGEETLLEAGIKRIFDAPKGEGFLDKLTELPEVLEGGFQTFGGLIDSTFNAAGTTLGELVIRPGFETLDTDTLEKFRKISSAPVDKIQEVLENPGVQQVIGLIGKGVDAIPDNLKNDAKAFLNIFGFKKGAKFSKEITPTGIKAGRVLAKEGAEQTLKDTGRAFLNFASKTTPEKELGLSKFFAKNVKPTNSIDNVASQFIKKGNESMNTLSNGLKSVTKKFKPLGAKEVLVVMRDNLDNLVKTGKLPFGKQQLADVKQLIKKFDTDGLTLNEVNLIKKDINKYTKAWNAAGKEAAGVSPDAMRDKYTEVMKFIENNAPEGIDVKSLNQDWIKSSEIFELMSKQATSVGKKRGLETLQQKSIIQKLGNKILQLRKDLGLTDIGGKQSLADLDLKKAIETIQKLESKIK